MKAKLIVTDAYFNIFSILTEKIKNSVNGLKERNFIFCEEKLTLMTERRICDAFGGSFNTEVYSFGNFLRARKPMARPKTLPSSMAQAPMHREIGSLERTISATGVLTESV